MSPNKRTLDYYRSLGFTIGTVEQRLPIPGKFITRDYIGIIDLIAFRAGSGILGIQTTSGDHHATRRTKALAIPALREWIESGGRFEIVSWAVQGGRGERKRWTARREEIRAGDFA